MEPYDHDDELLDSRRWWLPILLSAVLGVVLSACTVVWFDFPGDSTRTLKFSPPARNIVVDRQEDPVEPIRILAVGDSSMSHGIALGFIPYEAQTGDIDYVAVDSPWTANLSGAKNGCGLLGDDWNFRWTTDGPWNPMTSNRGDDMGSCDWRRWVPAIVKATDPDVIVASFGGTGAWDFLRVSDSMISYAGDEPYNRAYLAEIDAMESLGVPVLWLGYPPVSYGPSGEKPQSTEDRNVVANLLYAGQRCYYDLNRLVNESDFHDGSHLTLEAVERVVPTIVEQAKECVGAGQ